MAGRALVLGGGGLGGIAWLLGLIDGLRDDGVDLTIADLFVGTSAGSVVAVQIATGELAAAVAMQGSAETAEREVAFDNDAFVAALSEVAATATGRRDAARRIANLPQLSDIDEATRRAVVAARLPSRTWPDRPLRIPAVAQADGERVVFDRGSGVELVSAVAASCAVPGVWPPTTIDGVRYVDGGVHSGTNADLAAGHDRTVILVPARTDDNAERTLAWERRQLAPGTTHVVRVDAESLDAIGPNALDPACRPAALAAGRAQASRVAPELSEVWI